MNNRAAQNPDLSFTSTEEGFKNFLLSPSGAAKNLLSGRVKISGGADKLLAFRSYLIKL